MAGTEPPVSRTEQNLWSAIIGEAMANLKYQAFAQRAMEEGYPEVAQVFQEVSGAELVHGISHLRAAGAVKPTPDNLRAVVAGESREAATLYPRMVREALDEGRADAANSFILAMERENRHMEAFTSALEALNLRLQGRREDPAGPVAAAAPPPPVAAPGTSLYVAAAGEVERERWRVAAATRVREVVFGAQDGLLSTVALVTSVAVATASTTVVLVAGLASALAGMVSMATGSYLGSKAEREVQLAEMEKEARELEENPAEEMAELVVLYQREGMPFEQARQMAEHIASDRELWLRTMVEKELGLSAEATASPVKDGLTMGAAFIGAAAVPILPYFLLGVSAAVPVSVAAALAGLFALGAGKGRMVRRSALRHGLEMLVIGTLAAGLAYLLGDGIPRLIR